MDGQEKEVTVNSLVYKASEMACEAMSRSVSNMVVGISSGMAVGVCGLYFAGFPCLYVLCFMNIFVIAVMVFVSIMCTSFKRTYLKKIREIMGVNL